MLKPVGALPAGETRLDREHLAVLPTPVEFHHRTTGQQRGGVHGIADRQRARPTVTAAGTEQLEWLADHLSRVVAEDCRRAGIPDRDQMILIETHQAIAKRHRDTLEAVLRDAAEQSPEIYFVERNGGEVHHDRNVQQ